MKYTQKELLFIVDRIDKQTYKRGFSDGVKLSSEYAVEAEGTVTPQGNNPGYHAGLLLIHELPKHLVNKKVKVLVMEVEG